MNNVVRYKHYLEVELMRSPLTVRAYIDDLVRFSVYIDSTPIEGATIDDLRSYVMSMIERGDSPRSVNRRVSALRNFFDFLIRDGICDKNPCSVLHSLRIKQLLPHFVSKSTMETLTQRIADESDDRGYLPVRDCTIMLTLYFTGLRRAELASLDVDSIDSVEKLIKFVGKGSKERIVPLSDELWREMARYLQEREKFICNIEQKALFLDKKGGRISHSEIYRVVKRELTLAGVDGRRSPHVLRHTFATHLVQSGVGVRTVQQLLGHSSIASTQIYAHNTIDSLKQSYNKAHPRANKKQKL